MTGGGQQQESPTEVERMRGRHDPQVSMPAFIDPEERVPRDHPLRVIKRLADAARPGCRTPSTPCTPRASGRPSRPSGC